jgi:hypothetical protein
MRTSFVGNRKGDKDHRLTIRSRTTTSKCIVGFYGSTMRSPVSGRTAIRTIGGTLDMHLVEEASTC